MSSDDDDLQVPGLGKSRRARPAAARGGGGMGVGTIIVTALVTALVIGGVAIFLLKRMSGTAATAANANANASATPGAGTNGAAGTPGGAASGEQGFRMPDFVRVPLENARTFADALGLQFHLRERRADPSIPSDAVSWQTPPSGTQVRRGDAIDVIVSTGTGGAAPPTVAAAVPTPAAVPGAPVVAPTPAAPAAPGVAVPGVAAPVAVAPPVAVVPGVPGGAVAAAGDLVEVPRFVGRRFNTIAGMMTQSGLRLGRRREEFDEDRGPYVVLRQSVPAGTRVPRGTSIDLVVNQGE